VGLESRGTSGCHVSIDIDVCKIPLNESADKTFRPFGDAMHILKVLHNDRFAFLQKGRSVCLGLNFGAHIVAAISYPNANRIRAHKLVVHSQSISSLGKGARDERIHHHVINQIVFASVVWNVEDALAKEFVEILIRCDRVKERRQRRCTSLFIKQELLRRVKRILFDFDAVLLSTSPLIGVRYAFSKLREEALGMNDTRAVSQELEINNS
jgi:hypothetical protein